MRAGGFALGRIVLPVAVAVYPFAFYIALTRHGARAAAMVALCGAVLLGLRAVRGASGASRLSLLKVPLAIALLSLLSGLFNDGRFLLALPVLINLLLLFVFGSSLRAPQTYVERLARLRDWDFTDAKVRHCRQVTWVWVVFFILNAAVTAGLAVFGSVKAWTFHTSVLSYVLMGILFAGEWVVRKLRFGSHPRTGGCAVSDFRLALGDASALCAFGAEGAALPDKLLPDKTYGELRALALALAAALRASGGAAQSALLLCEDRFYFAAALLGAFEAGLSVTLPPSRGSAALATLGATHVSVHDGSAPLARGVLLDVRAVERELPKDAAAAVAPLSPVDAERVLVTLYTSGSQGEPVAWRKRARQILGEAALQARSLGFSPAERVLATVPAQHIYGLLFGVLAPLAAGGSFARTTPLHGASIVGLARAAQVTRLVSVPAHYEVVAEALEVSGRPELLRAGVSSGARLAPALAKRLAALGLDVVDVLGSTETGGIALRRPAQSERYVPLEGVSTRTDEHERLVIRSPFLEDPERDYLAGDRAQLFEDGSFEHLGRGDDVVKVGGKRVALSEIEAECLRLPGVRAAAALRHEVGGLRGQEIWLAAVAPGYSAELLRAALRERLDAVLVPRRVRLLDELPIDERGKLRRAHLVSVFAESGARQSVREKTRERSEESVRVLFEVPVAGLRFDGHFIGDPLLPALAQLHDLVLPVLRTEWPELGRLARMTRVKFTSPIRPGAHVQMTLSRRGERVDFDLAVAGASSARGCLHFGAAKAAATAAHEERP